jgi:hypothetical protein
MSNLISLTCTDHTAECDIRRPIEPLISNDTSLFRGVVHKRTRRIVLYNFRADKPYELVGGAVKSYACKYAVPYIASLIFQLNNRIITDNTKYITNFNAMIVLSGRYYYNYCYEVCILSNIRLRARIDRSVLISNVMIPEQQDHSTYRQDTEAGNEPNHRIEHGQYYINRRQKTNAVM